MSVFGFCNNKCKHEVYTKEEINDLLLSTKPVGSIEINITGINPSEYIGGTWEAWGSGRVPVGVDTTQTEFETVEQTGGEKTHTLTIDEMPQHNHSIFRTSTGTENFYTFEETGTTADTTKTANTGVAGKTKEHNNLQPYITCYMWKRIA